MKRIARAIRWANLYDNIRRLDLLLGLGLSATRRPGRIARGRVSLGLALDGRRATRGRRETLVVFGELVLFGEDGAICLEMLV